MTDRPPHQDPWVSELRDAHTTQVLAARNVPAGPNLRLHTHDLTVTLRVDPYGMTATACGIDITWRHDTADGTTHTGWAVLSLDDQDVREHPTVLRDLAETIAVHGLPALHLLRTLTDGAHRHPRTVLAVVGNALAP